MASPEGGGLAATWPLVLLCRGGGDLGIIVVFVALLAGVGAFCAHLSVAVAKFVVSAPELRERMGRGAIAGLFVGLPLMALGTEFSTWRGPHPDLYTSPLVYAGILVVAGLLGTLAGAPGFPSVRRGSGIATGFWLLLAVGSVGSGVGIGATKYTKAQSAIDEKAREKAVGPAYRSIRQLRHGRSSPDRRRALQELIQFGFQGDRHVLPGLAEGLRDGDPSVRRAAAEAIATVAFVQRQNVTSELIAALGEASGDSDAEVRLAAVAALGACSYADDLPEGAFAETGSYLRGATSDRDSQVRAQAQNDYRQWWYRGGNRLNAAPPPGG